MRQRNRPTQHLDVDSQEKAKNGKNVAPGLSPVVSRLQWLRAQCAGSVEDQETANTREHEEQEVVSEAILVAGSHVDGALISFNGTLWVCLGLGDAFTAASGGARNIRW